MGLLGANGLGAVGFAVHPSLSAAVLLPLCLGVVLAVVRWSRLVSWLQPVRSPALSAAYVLGLFGLMMITVAATNNATIALEALPDWARNHGSPTQYDLMLQALSARGVSALDLRPALHASVAAGATYHRHDTHWTPRGAVAAVNAILDWSGAGWRVDPAAVLGAPAPKLGGDEAKMLGLEEEFSEEVEPLRPPHRPIAEPVDQAPYREAGGLADGRRVLIIGDSFTYSFFGPVLRPGVKELMWLANRDCDFDWSMVLEFHPDEVWWMPTERSITCSPQSQPRHLEIAAK